MPSTFMGLYSAVRHDKCTEEMVQRNLNAIGRIPLSFQNPPLSLD